jgi:L-ascorbate metabolism protein UlaG (beta-lactamase superfamily)
LVSFRAGLACEPAFHSGLHLIKKKSVGKSNRRGEKVVPHFHGMTLQWLGHATFHLQTAKGTSILIDPWMESNPSFPKGWKAPEKIDLVLCSHGHGDHMGDALSVDKRYHPTFVGIYELTSWLSSKGVKKTVGMNLGGTFRFQDVSISLVEAKHSSSIDDNGATVYAGVAAGYVLQVEGEPTLYHSGDTALFSDMKLLRELYAPAIACLPIGDHFTMGPRAAALAAEYVGAKTVIPMHYGTFPVLTGTPEELRSHLRGKEIEVIDLRPGESLK